MNVTKECLTAHICNYEINLTFRRQVAVTIETETTIKPFKPYLAATIEA